MQDCTCLNINNELKCIVYYENVRCTLECTMSCISMLIKAGGSSCQTKIKKMMS